MNSFIKEGDIVMVPDVDHTYSNRDFVCLGIVTKRDAFNLERFVFINWIIGNPNHKRGFYTYNTVRYSVETGYWRIYEI